MRNVVYFLSVASVILTSSVARAEDVQVEPALRTVVPPPVTYFQTPFEPGGEHGELIFVTVRLNGEEVPFVLDTGAPTLILNSAHFPEAEDDGDHPAAYGVSGSVAMRSIAIDEFDWHGIRRQNVEVIGSDLSHLETATGSELVGLIGFDLVKDFELLIDYKAKQLTLFRPGFANFHRDVQPRATIPFTLEAHIPVVVAAISGKVMHLGIDTGASVNLLDQVAFDRLEEATDYVAKATDILHGADKNETTVPLIEIEKTRIDPIDVGSMIYTVADISHLNNGYGLELSGLLGYPFLSHGTTSISFVDEKIYLWDREVKITIAAR